MTKEKVTNKIKCIPKYKKKIVIIFLARVYSKGGGSA